MKTYFDTAVREGRYYSEDWTFCENWRDFGGKVWVDKRVLLKHTGTYVFDYAVQPALYQGLKEEMERNGQLPVAQPVNTPTSSTQASDYSQHEKVEVPAQTAPVQAKVVAKTQPQAKKAKTKSK